MASNLMVEDLFVLRREMAVTEVRSTKKDGGKLWNQGEISRLLSRQETNLSSIDEGRFLPDPRLT